MQLAELKRLVDQVLAGGLDDCAEVLLHDLATGENIMIDSVGLDGDDNFVIKFDYSG